MPSIYSIEYSGNKPHKKGTLAPIGCLPPSLTVPLAGSCSVMLGTNFIIYDPTMCDFQIITGKVESNEISPRVTFAKLTPGTSTIIISRQSQLDSEAATRISFERI